MSGGVKRIALFGKGHELWPVAAVLGRSLPAGIEIIVVEAPGHDRAIPLTIRLDDPLLARLAIMAEEFQDMDSAVLALGTELRDWRGEGSRFFLGGSGRLPDIDDIAIHQIMLRAALAYDQPDRLDYLCQPFRVPARLAAAGKFAFQASDPRSPLSMIRPTIQIGSDDYAALLKRRIASERMEIVEGAPRAVSLASDDGSIDRVELDSGHLVEADFYIDVSGLLSGLAGPLPTSGWHVLSDALPFDRLLSVRKAGASSQPPAVAQAVSGGLMITTALGNETISQLVCASGDAAGPAQQWLGAGVEEIPFASGYARQPWTGNLVRLGSASACFGPFLSADITLLHRQAVLLEELLPTRSDMRIEAGEFNRRHLMAAEHIRDYMLLPFALNGRDDAPWSGIRNGDLPDSLAIRLEQFRSRGRFVAFESEIFDEQSWIDLMIGFGVVPERYDPMARSLDMATTARRLRNLASAFDQALASVPE